MSITKKYLLVTVIAASAFMFLAFWVQRGTTLGLDDSILNAIASHRSATLNTVVKTVTQCGRPELLFPVGLLLCLYLAAKKHVDEAFWVVLLFIGTGIITSLLKEVYDRVRPEQWLSVAYESSFSFPSGHASTSMIIAITAASLLWHLHRWRKVVLAVAALYVVIIALTRLYLSVHYPSDILAGWFVAIGWFALINSAFSLYVSKKYHQRSDEPLQ